MRNTENDIKLLDDIYELVEYDWVKNLLKNCIFMYLYGIDWENLPEGQVIGIYYYLSADLGHDELPLTCPCGRYKRFRRVLSSSFKRADCFSGLSW